MSKVEKFWENATADDVARVMAGEAVEARFRDDEGGKWLESDHSLGGYDSTEEFCKWISSTGCPWRFCQVYREPSWWTDRPDPGPGYRLLGKFPDEPVAVGDEFFKSGEWYPSCLEIGDPQSVGLWYRRRIEPVESVEHYLGKVEAIKQFIVGDTFWHPNGLLLKITEKGFEVVQ
jgi:hypothetical protein